MVNLCIFHCLDIPLFFQGWFSRHRILGQQPFSFSPLTIRSLGSLSSGVSIRKPSVVNHIKVCLDMVAYFSNTTFKILSGFDRFGSAVHLGFCIFLIDLMFPGFVEYINPCFVSNLGNGGQLFLQLSFQPLSHLCSNL